MKNSVLYSFLLASAVTFLSFGWVNSNSENAPLPKQGYLMELFETCLDSFQKELTANPISFAFVATCSGYADVVDPATTGVNYSNGSASVLGAPDGDFGELHEGTDSLIIDLSDVITAGEDYTITWRRKPSYGTAGTADMVIEESSDNVNWSENSVRPATSSSTFITSTVSAESNTRYLRISQETGGGNDLDFDAVAYSNVLCGGEALPGNLSCSAAADEIEGVVFIDYNFDGYFNSGSDFEGLKGMPVLLTDSLGNTFSGVTNVNGAFSIGGLTANRTYRVEFTFPDSLSWAGSTFHGGDNGTTVQFVQAGNCAHLGVASPMDYCQANPILVTNCFIEGDNTGADDVLVSFEADMPSSLDHESYANQIGTTYGLAYQRSSNNMFASAFIKRFAGLAGSPGSIFIISDPYDGSTSGAEFIDLNVLFGTDVVGADPHDFVTQTGDGDVIDSAAYAAVGKIGFGDIDINEDERSLWAINLNDRNLYNIPLGNDPENPTAPTMSSEVTIISLVDGNIAAPNPLPDLPAGITDNEIRPFALKVKNGKVYIGVVTSGEDGGSINALVYAYDIDGQDFTKVLEFALNYNRGCALAVGSTCYGSANWNSWTDTYPGSPGMVIGTEHAHPQPIFGDIDFDASGNMLIGLRDRFGDQTGYQVPRPNGATTLYTGDGLGDILLAEPNGSGGWTLTVSDFTDNTQSTHGSGSTGGENFFGGDYYEGSNDLHEETACGGLVTLPGQHIVVTTNIDPITSFSAGTDWFNTSTGAYIFTFEVLPQGLQFNKANGLGELEAACDPAPIEIGNYVWFDEDTDGVQDAGEPGLDSIRVELYDMSGVLLAFDTTDANGEYYFSGENIDNATWLTSNDTLENATMYYIVVGQGQFSGDTLQLNGINYFLTVDSINAGANRYAIDSDGELAEGIDDDFNGLPYVKITTGDWGTIDHTFDFGFGLCQVTSSSVAYNGCEGDGYSVSVNGTTYNEANPTGTETLTNVAGCDSLVSVDLVFNPNSTGSVVYDGCLGDGYFVTVNGTLYNMFNPTGTEILTDVNGCDSIVTITLTYHPNPVTDVIATLCPGDSMVVNGTTYNESNPSGSEVFFGGSQYGCDSTVSVNLTFYPTALNSVVTDHCDGDGYSIVINGVLYNQASPFGQDTIFGGSSMGCDSIIYVDLDFYPETFSSIIEDHCEGDGYSINVGGTVYNEANPSGTEVITNVNGCDSTVTIDLTYKPTSVGSETFSGCSGAGYSVTVNGTLYNEANPTGVEVLTNSVGCDSTVTIDLTFSPTTAGSENYNGCEGDGYSVTVNGTLYNEANPTGTEVLSNEFGCDSTVTINLVFNTNLTGNENYNGCEGDGYSVTVNGTLYNEANPSGTETLTSYLGCDSIVTINLVYNPNSSGSENYTGCTGDGYSVTVNGTLYNEANPNGTEVLTDQNGCDSTVTVNLIFNPNSTGSETYTGCAGDGYSVTVNGTLYNEANPTGTEVLTNSNGCDSTVTVNLIFNPGSAGSETYTGCAGDGYSVTVNGTLYNEGNPTGTEVLTNQNGCDSTVTINLLYNPNSTGSESYTGCAGDGYSVTVNGTLYNEANQTGTEVLTDQNGCDSTVTINLVFNTNLFGNESYTGCEGDGYSVTVNGTLYNEANPTGTESMTSVFGCDSIITINLVFNPATADSETYAGCQGDGYSVTVNGTLYNEANPTGTEVLTNQNVCDSTVTINLVYNSNSTGSESYTGCEGDGYSVTVNSTLYDEANPNGTEVLVNQNGCDSTVTINLVYNPSTSDNETYTGCESDGYSVSVNGTLYNEANPTGMEIMVNQYGCDSIVTVNLVYNPNPVYDLTETLCTGSSITVNGTEYNEANPTGTEVLVGGSQFGCDSTINVNLSFNSFATSSIIENRCDGDGYSINVNGTTYNQANPSGTETITGGSYLGCDSVITISLTYHLNSSTLIEDNRCQSDGYSVTVNGTLYNEGNPNGTEVLTNSNGCDSTVTINLVYHPNTTGSEAYEGCEGDGYSVTVNGTLYNEANSSGTEVLNNSNGCDSTVTISLVYYPNTTGSETYEGCEGDGYSVTVNGALYDEWNPSGTEVLTNSNGCDSTVTISLVYHPNSSGSETYEGCEGDGYSVTVNGTLYNEANPSGTEVLTNSNGCDSTVTISLVYHPNSSGGEIYEGCEGDGYSVTVNGTLYNEGNPSGTEVLANSNGCDSTVTISLVYNPHVEKNIIETLCTGGSLVVNGTTYNEANPSGVETLAGGAQNGCDSIINVDLSFDNFASNTVEEERCEGDGYSIDVNGTIYNEANPVGTETITNGSYLGCDSVITINLIFNPTTIGSESYTGCEGDGYSVTVNGTLYNEANPTGTEVLTNQHGCDSTVTVNLVFNPNTVGSETYEGCEGDGYSVTVNGVIYDEGNPSGIEVISNANGCDSTIMIDLTFLSNSESTIIDYICEDVPYFHDGIQYFTTGNYQRGYTAANGCDSTVFLNLTLQTVTEFELTDTLCPDSVYNFFGNMLTSGGTYHDTMFYAGSGCDSIRTTLNLIEYNNCTDEFDIALRKTLAAGQSATVYDGDTVTFTIYLFNQGNVDAYNVVVLDYESIGLDFDAALSTGWVDFGGGPTWVAPYLPVGGVDSLNISFVANKDAGTGYVANYAEIVSADDDTNNTNTYPTDTDSSPNAFQYDDPGGDPDTPADDAIDGDGTGAPGSNDPLTDEDDHDGAHVFVIIKELSLGNLVFHDVDNDGEFNNSDTGIDSVEVELYDLGVDEMKGTNDDNLLATDTTDVNGNYLFEELAEGLYYVKLNGTGIPAGFVSSTGEGPTDFDASGPYEPASNTDNNIDNEDDGTQMSTMIMSDTIRLTIGGEPENGGNANNTVDFGLYDPEIEASLGDYVWYDDDVDGQQDSSEVGVPAVVVDLYNLGVDGLKGGGDDNLIASTSTDSTGYYLFENLTPGSFYVQFDLGTIPTEYYPTTMDIGNDSTDSDANAMGMTDVVILGPNEHNPTVDMGIYDPMFDLALYKDLSSGQSSMVDLGDDVRYDIRVENEGVTTAYNVVITDHIPTGLILSPTDSLWTSVDDSTATYTIPTPIPPGGAVTVEIILAVQYGASGVSFINVAEVDSATDVNGNNVEDIDSTPDNGDPNEDDIDDEEITLLDHDPTGWIYCEKTGEIITGGTITVVGPNGIPNDEVVIISDGTNGYYEFFAVGLAGTYTIQYSHPSGYPLSVDCPPGDTLDPTNMMPPVVLGSLASGSYMDDYACGANPYYFHFDLEFGDPAIFANNIPVQCTFIRSIVCEDSNNNDSIDVADTPVPNVQVYLYDCADTITPIDSTMSDALGNYAFDKLLPGDYLVGFGLSQGERFVSNGPINQNGLSDCINLGWGDCDTSKVICIYLCPEVTATGEVICYGEDGQLLATNPYGNGSYSWAPGGTLNSSSIPNPIANPLTTTAYIVTYDDGFGCVDSDTATITVRNTTPYLTYTPFTDVTVECSETIPFDAPAFADSCDLVLDVVLDSVITNNACGYTITRTWTATNDQGNSNNFVQTVTVVDTTPPSMSASHPILGTLLHGNTYYADCEDIPSLDSLGFAASDLCSATTVTFEENVIPGNCDVDEYLEMRYCGWTATDSCGNTDSLYFTIFVTDTVAPVLDGVPADTLVDCENIPPIANVTATDNCSTPSVVLDEMTWGDTINGCYIVMRTWTATDSCGNSTSASQQIQVTDTVPPVLQNVPANGVGECSDPPPPVTAIDNCDTDVTIAFTETVTAADSAGCVSQILQTWTATDDCGNQAIASRTVLVDNTVPPVITVIHPAMAGVQDGDVLYLECQDLVSLSADDASATADCCGDPTIEFFEYVSLGDCLTDGYWQHMECGWVATDCCGNVDSLFFTVYITDTTAPDLYGVPADMDYSCQGDVPMPEMVFAVDNCYGVGPVSFNETTSTINGFEVIIRTWSVTDQCGNTRDSSQVITLTDQMAPFILNVPADTTVYHPSAVPVPSAQVIAVDSCDMDPMLVVQDSTSGGDCCYTITRTWTATNDSGMSSTASQIITVQDTVAPVITGIPVDDTVQCEFIEIVVSPIMATDNCTLNPLLELSVDTIFSTCGFTITRTWTATDDCGNTTSESQVIIVTDSEAPEAEANHAFFGDIFHGDTLYADCTQIPSLDSLGFAATDNCDDDLTITFDEIVSTGDCATDGYLELRYCGWTATDDCGNTDSLFFVVIISDTTAPLLSGIPADVTVDCNSIPPVDSSITVTDDCTIGLVADFVENQVSYTCLGTYTLERTWSATDSCGNTTSATQIITVIDTVPPTMSANHTDFGDIFHGDTLYAECSQIPSLDSLGFAASDDCSDVEITFTETVTVGDCEVDGFVELRYCGWTATDSCGNSDSLFFTIIVIDTVPPVMSANHADFGDIFHGDTLYADCSQIPSLDSLGFSASDDCSDVEITFTENVTEVNCAIDGFIETRYCGWTATDSCGNTDSLFFIVIVTDTVAPELVGVPADLTVECDSIMPTNAMVTATDACFGIAEVVMESDTIPGNCFGEYTIENTWIATDSCGNMASATQVISVVNTTPPMMQLTHASLGALMDGDTVHIDCAQIASLDSLTFFAYDACCDVNTSFTENVVNGNCAMDGFIELRNLRWISTDCCGNADSIFITMIATDTVAPELIGVPSDVTVECDELLPADSVVTAIDACFGVAEVTMLRDSFPGPCFGTYIIENTWIATDSCGNSTSATQVITVDNTTPPVMEASHAFFGQIFHGDTLYADCTQIPSLDSLGFLSYDACCDVNITFTENVTIGDCDIDGFVESRYCGWTATDCCGNSDNLFFTVIVQDLTPPELMGVPNDTIVLCDSIPAAVGPTAFDLCDSIPNVYAVDSLSNTDCPYIITRVWYAEDACGNITTDTQYIEAVERFYVDIQFVNPDLFGLMDGDTLIVDCSDPDAFALEDAEATTNCGGAIDFTFEENFVAYGDCPQDHFIALLSNTWIASACGADTSITVYLLYIDSVGPVFTYTPADTTIACDDEVPAFGTPIAEDACGGVALTSVDSTVITANGQDLLRIWTATDDCGNETYFTQTIHVEGGITPQLESISVSPEICDGADGAVIVEVEGDEANFDYTWIPDVGFDATPAGNARNGLTAGNYEVIVSNGGCSDTFQFTIKDECGCEPAVVDSLSILEATCGMNDGSAEIFLEGDMSEYGFTWIPNIGTPNTLNNGRTGLPAGHYVVIMVHNGDNSCVATLEFDIYDDCNRCGPIFEIDALTTFVDSDPATVCLPVPFGVAIGMDITINGQPFMGAINECDLQDVTAYDYSTVPNMAQEGPFHVIWEHDGLVFSTVVENMDQLAAGMSQIDNNSDWYNDKKAFQLISENLGGDYGSMIIYTIETGEQTGIDPTNSASELGTYIQLPVGTNEIEFINEDGSCSDMMTVTLEMVQDANLFQQDTLFISGSCTDDVYDYCFEIPAYLFDEFYFSLNGQSIDDQLEVCSYKEVIYYTYAAMAANQPPYEVMSWSINGDQQTATFDSFSELVDLLNQWDASGNWILNNNNLSIEGGDLSNSYSSLKLRHPASGQIVDLAVNTLMTIDQYGLQLQPGIYNLAGSNFTDGLADNLTLLIACTTVDNQSVSVSVGAVDTVCFTSNELLGGLTGELELCDNTFNDNADITIIPGTNCLEIQGQIFGNDQTCVVVCDEFGFCDTTYLQVRILPKKEGPPQSPNEVDPDLLIVNNGFSPNGDGINDYFSIEGIELEPEHTLTIFDRFGKKVYSTKNYQNNWGGSWGSEEVKDGTYYYLLEMKGGKRKSGYIQILR